MSDLEAAIADEIDECEYEEVEVSPIDTATICAIHGCDWDEDETIPCWERRRMTAALRRGWDAAINAAAEKAQDEINHATQERARVAPSEVGHYRASGGVVAGFRIRDAIAALLSEGGGP